jgi:hypothetical protein
MAAGERIRTYKVRRSLSPALQGEHYQYFVRKVSRGLEWSPVWEDGLSMTRAEAEDIRALARQTAPRFAHYHCVVPCQ